MDGLRYSPARADDKSRGRAAIPGGMARAHWPPLPHGARRLGESAARPIGCSAPRPADIMRPGWRGRSAPPHARGGRRRKRPPYWAIERRTRARAMTFPRMAGRIPITIPQRRAVTPAREVAWIHMVQYRATYTCDKAGAGGSRAAGGWSFKRACFRLPPLLPPPPQGGGNYK